MFKNHLLLAGLAWLWLPAMGLTDDSPKLRAANGEFYDAITAARTAYRQSLAAALSEATKIELFLLDFETQKAPPSALSPWSAQVPEDVFPIVPYHSTSRIMKRKVLTAAQIEELRPALQATIGVKDREGGAMCHFPIHGLRIWIGETLACQTSFCWHCQNFYLEYPFPDENAEWIGLSDARLKEIINRLLPIPKKELERFEKKYRPEGPPKTEQK